MAIDLDVHGNTKPLEAAVQAAVNRIRRQPIKITVDDKGATQPLGNMKRGADEFTKSMEAANARILAFGASMAIINGVANAFKGMVKNLVEVEKAMADVNVVMGLSAQNLEKFSDGLFKVAKETGAAFRVAADAATEYARQGLGVEESLKRTRDALVLTRLTGMDSAEAVKSLTAAMNTYGTQIKDTTQLVSKFAAVDVKFAVSAQDFADAISRTGQSAQSAGVSIDELVGIVTAAQQKTARGGAVIGNALKTIFTKTGKTDTLNQLENLGIAVRDLEGNTIGAKRILTDLADTFDTLSAAQKAQITQTMGGLFHINILKAVLSDAAKQNGIMAEATRISAGATDEAIQKNEELRKTMSAVATETGLAIKQVSTQIGEIALAPGMEKILNAVKSLAEGLSGVLGDGEGMGNKFATGLLKGIGNVITGPGLVVLASVFFKLFGQALKFTKESLTSLVGVTTEKQKQKAIQTSLVALFGQNAALNKEMLRTDIGRTEKEKIILGLLRAQVVEASSLNKLTAGMAGTLYRKGYGANLTPVGKKAGGHIPNYANPERAQAAQGGYAAGSIRTMNMPGEGPVIYNSAETVKNFAGFKQPAIMPPQSSKAGKNYQQAFGDIHGFDPYAAGGYIPNFKKSKAKTKEKAGPDINLNRLFKAQTESMGVLLGFGSEGAAKGQEYSQTYNSLPPKAKAALKKKNVVDRGTSRVVAELPTKAVYEITDGDVGRIQGVLGESELEKKLYHYVGNPFDKFSQAVGKDMFGGKIGKAGINVLKSHMEGSVLGGLFEAAVRGSLDNKKVADSQAPFDFTGSNAKNISEFMGNDNLDLIEAKYNLSAAKSGGIPKKILNYINTTIPGATTASKTSALGGVLTRKGDAMYINDEPFDSRSDKQKKALKGKGFEGTFGRNSLKKLFNSRGFIPNFADPLSDAIGREKAAGVPVSQIRVGSHGSLMGKGNPLGLGVTNTHDEPNGLRDVFGANGFVPNYAEGFAAGDIGKDAGNNDARKALARKINEQIQSIDASIYSEEDYRKEIDKIIKKQKKNGKSIELSKSGLDKASQISKRNTAEIQKNTVSQQANTIASQSNTTQTAANTAKRKTLGAKLVGGIKNMNQGMGGMGLMMGLPMLAGFIPGADKPGSAGGMVSGALSGAATGASIGMMFPGWGTAIGAAVGALGGFVTSLDSAKDAIKEEAYARGQFLAASFGGVGQKIFSEGSSEEIKRKKSIFGTFGSIPEEVDFDWFDSAMEMFSSTGTSKFKTKREVDRLREDMMSKMGPTIREEFLGSLGSFGDEEMNLPKIIFDQEAGKKTISTKETEVIKASEFKDILQSSGALNDIDVLSALAKSLVKQYKVEEVNVKKTNNAIITRLNKEKISLSAQDTFNEAMNTSAVFGQMMAEQYQFKMATMSAYMTEEEIASAKLSEAKRVAANAYTKSVKEEEQKEKESIIDLLKDDKYKTGLTDYLKTNSLDETSFGSKSLEELQTAATEIVGGIAGGDKVIAEIIDNQNEKLRIQEEKYENIKTLAESRAELEKRIADELLRQQTGPGSFGRGMERGFSDMDKQVKRMDYELGKRIPTAFADGLAGAMTEAINGTKSIKEGLMDAAVGFLGMIQQAMMQKMAYQMVGAMGFSQGGNVRKYSKGGGVPAMVSNGEYVMSRDAVNKYGGSFMHGMNAGGSIPGFADGGEIQKQKIPVGGKIAGTIISKSLEAKAKQEAALANAVENHLLAKGKIRREGAPGGPAAQGSALAANFGGGRGFDSGRLYQRKAMSGAFYAQSGNVGLGEDTSAIQSILSEEERIRQEAEAKRQAKKAKRRQLLGMVASIGLMYGLGQMNLFGPKGPAPGSGGIIPGTEGGLRIGNSLGGPIRKYASGGHIAGKSGIDQIPAMLSEGEYVIRASSARQIGKPMLDQINAGKFNDGGAVSEIAGSSGTGSTGGNTNNISISINMERGSSNQKQQEGSDSSGQNPADRSNDEQSNTQLAERIKQQVVSVIVEEQRPGGLLSD